MADPVLGAKQLCPNCQAKFYDLTKRPAHCPKCGTDFDPEEALRTRRIRTRVVSPDYETDEDSEDQIKASEVDDEAEEEVVTPEIDQVADEDPILTPDDDDDPVEPALTETDDVDVDLEDDVDLGADDDDDVPFLEDDDDSFDEEIDGLPGEGDEEER